MKHLFYLLFFPILLSAQVTGEVFDAETNQPIPYVNIWVENENIGTNSEENGSFSLEISEEKNIVFSALGYQTKTISSTEISKVFLQPTVFQLNEIVLEKAKRSEEIILEDYSKKKVNSGFSNFGNEQVHIWAKIFDYNDSIVKYPFIKEIQFIAKSKVKTSKMRLRLFEKANPEEELIDLVEEDIIFEVKKGKREITVDLSQYNLKFPKKGLIVGFEYLKLEQNRYDFTYTNQGEKENTKDLVINQQ